MSVIRCLWRVSRPESDSILWDEFDSFVCVAATAGEARRLHPRGEDRMVWVESDSSWHPVFPNGDVDGEAWEYHSWTGDLESLDVVWLGEAGDGALRIAEDKGSVVLASFNAG